MKNIAIIPARSGSKGLKDKNIKELRGKPLMAYTIEAALQSSCFETVMVSTDSRKYADIARSYGAEVPFFRSERTSSDAASSWDTVLEVLDMYQDLGQTFDTFCLLQPTSPMRTADDIVSSYKEFEEKKAFAVLSMTELEHPISWCGLIGEGYSLNGFIEKSPNMQRQAQATCYRPNGAIYIVSIPEFRKDQFLYREGSYAYIMQKERSVDIDTEEDFKYAEFLMSDQLATDCVQNSLSNSWNELFDIQWENFRNAFSSEDGEEAATWLFSTVFLYNMDIKTGREYNHEIRDALFECLEYDFSKEDSAEKLSSKECIMLSAIIEEVEDIMHTANNPPECIILNQEEKDKVVFDQRICDDLDSINNVIESRRIIEIERQKKSAIQSENNSEDELDYPKVSISKPSRVSDSPFQFIENDPLIACVGVNGGTSNYDIFEGFARTVDVIYDSVSKSHLGEDAMVYPMAFSARHGIELGLKISIQELLDFMDMDKLSSRIKGYNRNEIDKVLLAHDIKALTESFVELLSVDKRLNEYEAKMSPYLSDYYFDVRGDMFRYAESRENIPNLANEQISHVALTQLRDRFSELVKLFEHFYSEIEMLYGEYKVKSYTTNLSRADIGEISKRMPNKSKWTEDSFDDIRNEIKSDYGISSHELSDAINIIKNVPEFSIRIGLEQKFHDIPDEELAAYWRLVEWYNNEENSVPDEISLSGITVEVISAVQRSLKGLDDIAKDISTETLNCLLVFFLVAHESDYSENLERYYEYVQKNNYHRTYLVRKLARKETFHLVKCGMQMCGQESYFKKINFMLM